MKKICILTPMFLPVPAVKGGAIENLIENLIDENEKLKIVKFDLYTVFDDNIKSIYKNTNIIQIKLSYFTRLIQRVVNKIFNVLKINKYYDFNGIKYKKIAKKINQENYDGLLIENNMQLYKYIYTHTNHNIPFYFHLHNDLNPINKSREDMEYILNTSKYVFVVSEYLKKKIDSTNLKKNIVVLKNTIDEEKYSNFVFNEQKIENLKSKYNIPLKNKIVGYVGRADEDKGILQLIKAFNSMNRKSTTLLLITDDFTSFKYKKEFHQNLYNECLKNKKNIVVTGRINYKDIIKYYKIIDVLVIPTIVQEAFGMVALEGRVLNKNIVYANSGALSEVLSGTNNIMVNLDDNFEDMLCLAINNSLTKSIKNKEKFKVNNKSLEEYYLHLIQYF